MKSASEMSKAIRAKKKMSLSDVEPENALETHMKDPIDELVDSYGDATESLDENHPDPSTAENSDAIEYPENDALKMKKKAGIAKIMAKMR